MMRFFFTFISSLVFISIGVCQEVDYSRFQAGYMNYQLIDSSRVYRPDTKATDRLHFRPIIVDIWFPSETDSENSLSFGELLGALETYALSFQDQEYKGLAKELAEQLLVYAGSQNISVDQLLTKKTNSYPDVNPTDESCPIVMYMAGQNGTSFENYPIFEKLAADGYVVISIWSVGSYPGNMTNSKEDMMEQVYDAEFVLKHVSKEKKFNVDTANIGLIGYSWGGMSAAVLNARHSDIKATVSLDGTETYYFGESEKEDAELNAIHDAGLLHPQRHKAAYLYLESGNKLNSFTPIEKYDYYEQKSGKKQYARFLNSIHEDFSCLPSLMNTSPESIERYQDLIFVIRNFLNENLKADYTSSYLSQQILEKGDVSANPMKVTEDTGKSTNIYGTVIDEETKKPIPYANLGIPKQKLGTVSNEKGDFSFAIHEDQRSDTLRVSCIGYTSALIPLNELAKQKFIGLVPRQEQLTEVVIEGKELRTSVIGNRAHSKFISTPFGYKQLGSEMGVKMRIKESPTYVDAFNVNVPYNRLHGKAVFRLNFYTIKDDKPFRNILAENILISITPGQTGRITTSLKDYNIMLTEDVIVSLEWVGHDGELKPGDGINFSLGFFNHETYVRHASQSEMEKKFGMGVGFNLDVRH